MNVCVLQPDYSTSSVDYQYYDPRRDLSPLFTDAVVEHVLLNKLTTYKQLKALSKKKYDVFVNLCEGYLEWEVPSIDVIYTLELLNLPFTGPTSVLYDPPKELMKYVASCEGVLTPRHVLIETADNLEDVCSHLRFPLFVKPAKAGDSLGVDEKSMVNDLASLQQKVTSIIDEYGELLIEEYIDGREFTVLIAANADGKTSTVYKPVEFIFPKGTHFKTYALKTSELHPDANIPCTDPVIDAKLRDAAQRIYSGFNGVGYARLDFRMNDKGELFFLEINFTCSVFYSDGYEGSADYILRHDGSTQSQFLQHIIAEGIARHQRKQKSYTMKGNAIEGYGIYATRDIKAGEVVFKGEEKAQRVVTRSYVEKTWSEKEKGVFKRYAYPVCEDVFILWDENAAEWAPQNHSCDPNTTYRGLNVVALCPISSGQELTLDYACLCNEDMEPFQCHCKSASCRGMITGIPNNTVASREQQARADGTI